MSKVNLSKVISVKSASTQDVEINGVKVTIKQYLPLEEKVSLVEQILNSSIDDLNDFNSAKVDMFYGIQLIEHYSNIAFTEVQLKDTLKLYNSLVLNNIIEQVENAIPEKELNYVKALLNREIERIRTYFQSVAGVINLLQQDYSATNMDVDGLIKKLQTGENFELVKDILTKTN